MDQSLFYFGKLLSALLEPVNLFALLLCIGVAALWNGRVVFGRVWLTLTLTTFLAVGCSTIPDYAIAPLEQRFPSRPVPVHVDGVIMLGGAQKPVLSAYHNQPVMNGAAERMTTFVALARQYPEAKLVFSGGSGDPRNQDVSEVGTVKMFLRQQGIPLERLLFEGESRNTYENVLFSKTMVTPRDGEVWLVVTSAADIPRAMGVFRKAQWEVIPVPCDYQVGKLEFGWEWSIQRSMDKLGIAIHEWVGMGAYFLAGRSSAIYPKP